MHHSVPSTSLSCLRNRREKICTLCCEFAPDEKWFRMKLCGHEFCRPCLEEYLKTEILESRLKIACPDCYASILPADIAALLKEQKELQEKYEYFMIRAYLSKQPDTRWCPAPDCGFAVIAEKCDACPRLRCQRSECGIEFCYHCKSQWLPNHKCIAALDPLTVEIAKPCPVCKVSIEKASDGSCNQMICLICGAKFCWLCLKKCNYLHYFNSEGCAFYGRTRLSHRKKIFCLVSELIAAPAGVFLVSVVATPVLLLAIPAFLSSVLYSHLQTMESKWKQIPLMISGMLASTALSPILTGLTIVVGAPVALYCVGKHLLKSLYKEMKNEHNSIDEDVATNA